MNPETLSIKHSRSQRMQHFPFSSLPSIQSTLWFVWPKQSLSFCFCPFPTVGVGLLVWVQFLIYIGSGGWIWSSCSLFLFHFKLRLLFQLTQSPHGCVKWANMLGTRGEHSYFHKKWWQRNSFFFFSSAETLIISQTANMGDVFIRTPHVYLSSQLYSSNLTQNDFDELWESQLRWRCWRITASNCVYWEQKTLQIVKRGNKRVFRIMGRLSHQEKKEKQKEILGGRTLTLIHTVIMHFIIH